ncbi:FMP21-like protein [Cordyceps fumosorosea ARSEF 2679]|uniref:Succinate dehydrogenase assembly factor 4, mitochondrial n=1 Tax=Cordyceps fumosorosea (strain ARSEF 2679) TaxID=1081104 RepID=A0A167VZW0_CORFA|nr:FMP21-like protein [Cordyceps fumosorosea ARSEF 2679]OAA63159.1 FMP21-like protein [Cordyceps fumosorosea ARSEF 2679]
MTKIAPLNQSITNAESRPSPPPNLPPSTSLPPPPPPTIAMLPRLLFTTMRAASAAGRHCHHSIPVAAFSYRHASSFGAAPRPPKLPAKEQAEFERLQREAAVSSAFQPEAATPEPTTPADTELNEGGGLYRGARPEFEGEKNPRTGEVGGPKNEPLRWGSGGDWSYNGKVTDF